MFKIIVQARYFFDRIGFDGMALYPFVLLKHKSLTADPYFINHEEIHLQQQKELLILPFYILYLFNYFFNLIKYRNRRLAYLNICFEREAYTNDHNLDYLKTRKPFGFLRYL